MTSEPRSQRTAKVLIVEDSLTQVVLFRSAIAKVEQLELAEVVRDGEEALSYLRREGRYQNAPRPDLILLDLHMPRKDGFDVLLEVKCDPVLRTIPIVIMSTTDRQADIVTAYERGANTFITKPTTAGELHSTLIDLARYWTTAQFASAS
jgi:CheY-like chemotaxis protein